MRAYLRLPIAFLLVTSLGCKEEVETSEASFDETSQSTELAVESLQSVIEDHQGGEYSYTSQSQFQKYAERLTQALVPQAVANSSCVRPAFTSCNVGVKEMTYSNCNLGASGATYSGSIALSYSDSSCALSNQGDYVVRTYEMTFTGPRGLTQIQFSSEPDQNYLGETHSGGGRLSKTSSGWEVEVLGRNQSVRFKGRLVADQSVKTTSPILVAGSLGRAGRIVNGGELVVSHNLAQYKSKFTPQNLQYTGTCCHPVSGSLSVQYEGSRTGSATITFNGCGSATYQKDSLIREMNLSYCQ